MHVLQDTSPRGAARQRTVVHRVFSTSVTWSSYWVLLVGSTAAFLASPPIGSPLGFAALRLGSASVGLLLAESLEKRLYSQYEYYQMSTLKVLHYS